MIGQTLGHYRIEAKLGEGGMGIVYKARATQLDRHVALKILPEAALADPERKRRFVQEARAASALRHPNVAHIYEIGEADGVHFIAMEYVEGRPHEHGLRQCVRLFCGARSPACRVHTRVDPCAQPW